MGVRTDADEDALLLREYAVGGSNDAFARLVGRYINLVYTTSLRDVRDSHMADDVTQAVFMVRRCGRGR